MIKVLQVGFTPHYGGVEACIMNYYRNIDRNKIQFGFINTWSEPLAYEDEIHKLGGKVYNISGWFKAKGNSSHSFIDVINSSHYDIVHFNVNSIANLIQFIAAEKSDAISWCVHSHRSGSIGSVIKDSLRLVNRKYICKKADKTFACSNTAKQWMFGNHKDTSIIFNAIDLEKFKFDINTRERIRKKYNLDQAFVIGHVGRLDEVKNHLFLLDIFKEIKKTEKKSKLLIVGDGEMYQQIVNKAKRIGIINDVILTGRCSNVNELYQAMDVFIMPSFQEGLPMVGVEAQAAGLPYLLTDTITREIDITDYVRYISLNATADQWARIALEYRNKRSENVQVQLTNSGFNIKEEADRLSSIYNEMYMKAERGE